MLQTQVTKSQRGFTLTETMIAVLILGGVVAITMVMVKNSQDAMGSGQVIDVRDQLATEIERAMQNFDNVQLSADRGAAPGNRMLRNCLDAGGGRCSATNPRNQETFEFMIKGGRTGVRILGGPASAPVLYDRKGVPNCRQVASAVDCPLWEVRAYFYATCPPVPPATTPAASCPQAASVHLRYQIVPTRPNLSRNDGDPGRALSARPPEPEFSRNPERYAISHAVGTALTADTCPANSEQVGWDGGGKIRCRCRFGVTQTGVDANGLPICPTTDHICGTNELLQGVDVDGKPICGRVRQNCRWITFADDSTDARCPNAGWLEAIDLGRCTAARRSKKAGERKITCSRNRGYCCYYEPI